MHSVKGKKRTRTAREVMPEGVERMPKDFCCPYYLWEEPLCIFCEGGKVRFRDFAHRRDYVYTYCAAAPGWEVCTVAAAVTKSYERSDKTCKRKKA